MKKLIKFIFILFFFQFIFIQNSFSHKEWVHQYICKEAYNFLENEFSEISEIKDYLGLNYFGSGGDDPWESSNSIVIGSWREDLEDIMWEYGGWFNGWTPSCVHFWKADNGDYFWTNIFLSGEVPNAWIKARQLVFATNVNDDFLFYDHRPTIFLYNGYRYLPLGLYRRYRDICDFVEIKEQMIYGFRDLMGNKYSLDDDDMRWIAMSTKKWPYNIVGRILHLLADMSVPAHVHNDVHPCELGDGDSYELWISSNDEGDCNEPHTTFRAQNWDAATSREQGGILWEVFSMPEETAIRYLFYTMNQLADHYPSWDVAFPVNNRDASGNNNLPNGTNPLLEAWYNELGDPPYLAMFEECANVNYNFSIRATATFLYWLATKTGLVDCPDILYIQNHTHYGTQSPYDTKFKADNKIIAGKSVRDDLPEGLVIHIANSISEYIAADEIILKDGFSAENGSEFKAHISSVPCSMSSSKNKSDKKNSYLKIPDQAICAVDAISSISIHTLESATFTGDTSNFLVISQFYKSKPFYYPGDYPSDSSITIDQISYISDTVRIFVTDTLLNDSLIMTMIGPYDVILTTDSVSITRITSPKWNKNSDFPNISISVKPNPSINSLDIHYILHTVETIRLKLIDNHGIVIYEIVNKLAHPPGIFDISIDSSKLIPGSYFIILKTSNSTLARKVIIIK